MRFQKRSILVGVFESSIFVSHTHIKLERLSSGPHRVRSALPFGDKGFAIEEMLGDGNCLYRAVAWQIYGDQEKHQTVRGETVKHINARRSYFSHFDTNIDDRLSEQLRNYSWGGHLEIAAISELYNVGVTVWELSHSGELVTPFDTSKMAASKGLKVIYLVRQRRIHYNGLMMKNQKLSSSLS